MGKVTGRVPQRVLSTALVANLQDVAIVGATTATGRKVADRQQIDVSTFGDILNTTLY